MCTPIDMMTHHWWGWCWLLSWWRQWFYWRSWYGDNDDFLCEITPQMSWLMLWSIGEVSLQNRKSSGFLHNYLNFPREGEFGIFWEYLQKKAARWVGWHSWGLHYTRDVGPIFGWAVCMLLPINSGSATNTYDNFQQHCLVDPSNQHNKTCGKVCTGIPAHQL